jgi:leucine dehydrogenase
MVSFAHCRQAPGIAGAPTSSAAAQSRFRCGSTGYHLAKELHAAGAKLVVADIDPQRVARVVQELQATAVAPGEILNSDADIFAPCAFGGIINDQTIDKLRVEIVVGSANNQLLAAKHGDALAELGILYAPDYVANAGGVINGCRELLSWDEQTTRSKVEAIYDTMLTLLRQAQSEGVPPFRMADQIAEQRLLAARKSSKSLFSGNEKS